MRLTVKYDRTTLTYSFVFLFDRDVDADVDADGDDDVPLGLFASQGLLASQGPVASTGLLPHSPPERFFPILSYTTPWRVDHLH